MADLRDRVLTEGLTSLSTAPMVNAMLGGQMGPLINQGRYVDNANYISQSTIVKVVDFPRWVDVMPKPEVFRRAIKNFFEVQSKVDGLNKALTADFVDTAVGGAGHRQYDLSNTLEAQSDITHTVTDKYGRVFGTLFEFWIRYGMRDPVARRPLITLISDDVTDLLPDWYCATVLYFEPDPTQQFVTKAWLCTNMAPRLNGPDEGYKDLERAGEVNELAIGFTSLQECSFGVVQMAQDQLDAMNKSGLNPMTRQPGFSEIDADVAATATGWDDAADALANEQL